MAENTFLGLQPYTEDDAYRFKGRTVESQELFRLIVRNDFTVCYAESGEGKTSLLNAGVFPLLRENMYFPIAITFTSDDYQVTPDNFSTIIDRCIKDSITEYNEKNKGINVEYRLCSTDFQGLDCQTELQEELSQYSWWKLRNYKPQAMGLTFTPVFVFDQFEEVFNMPGSIVWTKKLFDWLEDVSSDSCPDEIAKKIRAIIGNSAAFPSIKEEKDFKAVFSLRKEFIGELDYWGMQKCFIPSLKDNRYCLKALTYEGAKKVMTQQERFDEEKVEQILTHFVSQYSREPEKTIKEQLPIIPALLLSVVCDSWEKDISSFAKLSTDEISQSLNKIFEKFYDDTIDAVIKELSHQNASLSDLDSIRKDIDVAMFDLVDVNGKRVRVKAVTTLGTISMETDRRFSETLPIVKYKEILNQHRIVKITKIDGEDYVEIVHDSLCPVILRKKEQRIQEIENRVKRETERVNKLKEQREEFIASFATIPLAIFLSVFMSKLFHSMELVENLRLFGTISILVLANLCIIPALIYSAIKKFKTTLWLSVYGIISNAILMFFLLNGQEKEMGIRLGLATASVGIPLITLIYSIKMKLFRGEVKQELKKITTSISVLLFFWIISYYVFYLCIFNKALGLPEPFDSSWGVIVIPLLTHEIIRNALGQRLNKIAIIVFCCLLGLLTYNTSVVPFALSFFALICILGMTIGIIIWAFSGLTWGKRIMAILTDTLVLVLVVILNMGFNVSKVKYDTASHVFNWIDVVVYNQNNKVGIVSACEGDTLLPCKFDSLDHRQHHAFLNSNKVHYTKDIMDNKGLYSYKQSIDSAQWQCLFIDEAENNISKYRYNAPGTLRNDSLQVYAAKVYHEVRNANIDYFMSGRMYSLSDIVSLDTLMKLQNRDLSDILKEISNSVTATRVSPIDISQVIDFNKAFARSFYLCMLKDRIIRKDSVNIFNLTQEIVTLYFSNAGNFELNINYTNNFNMGGFHKIFSSSFKASELRNNTLDSWYNYIMMLLAMDMGPNAEEKVRHYTDVLDDVQSIHDRMNREHRSNLQRMSKILQKNDKLDLSDIQEALDIYKKQLEFTDEIKEQTNTQIDRIDMEKRQMDLDFQKFINNVFTTLSTFVYNSQNIYNSEFVDICEQLYLISVLRQYEIAPIYLQYLEQMDNSKNRIYSEFKKMQEQEDSLKQIIKSFQF